jgi:phosphoribosylaminoimidazole-succinocarboxamide synthase
MFALELLNKGKVRDVYRLDEDHLLILATDRLSAYDVVFPDAIPGKGVVLTALTRWWLRRLDAIVPVHWDPASDAALAGLTLPEWPDAPQRAMMVERCQVVPFECVVRGFAFGSYLKAHPEVPPMTPFAAPLFTPSTKAETGHDEPVTFAHMQAALGETADQLKAYSLALFQFASQICRQAGIVLVDTKFEFGRARDGRIKLIDECFTPDSSRFILQTDFDRGVFDAYDKQIVRDYVDRIGWDRTPPAPRLPPDIIDQTLARYRLIQQRITGAAHEV